MMFVNAMDNIIAVKYYLSIRNIHATINTHTCHPKSEQADSFPSCLPSQITAAYTYSHHQNSIR